MPNTFPSGWLFFRFEGIVALCVRRGRHCFDAAIVRDKRTPTGEIDDHAHSIEIVKWKDGKKLEPGYFPVFDYRHPARLLQLDIYGESSSCDRSALPGIQYLSFEDETETGFDRTMAFLFDWVISAKEAVPIEDAALRTRLRVTGIDFGLFIPGTIRVTPASLVKPSPSNFWCTAESLNAFAILPDDGAILRNLSATDTTIGEWKLPKEKGVSYEIIVKNNCEDDICSVDTTVIYNNLIKSDNGGPHIEFSMLSGLDDYNDDEIDQPETLNKSSMLDLLRKLNFFSTGPTICPNINFSGNDELPPPGISNTDDEPSPPAISNTDVESVKERERVRSLNYDSNPDR